MRRVLARGEGSVAAPPVGQDTAAANGDTPDRVARRVAGTWEDGRSHVQGWAQEGRRAAHTMPPPRTTKVAPSVATMAAIPNPVWIAVTVTLPTPSSAMRAWAVPVQACSRALPSTGFARSNWSSSSRRWQCHTTRIVVLVLVVGVIDQRHLLLPVEHVIGDRSRREACGPRTSRRARDQSRTVEAHFTSIFNRFGVTTRVEAVVHATARSWIRT